MAAAAVPVLPTAAAPPNYERRIACTGSILPPKWRHSGTGSFRSLRLKSTRNLVVRAARTESKGVSLGFKAPDFQLQEPLTGKTWELDDFESHPGLLVMFICNHCPFVKHLKKVITDLSNLYMKKGLAVVAISSNSVVTHPQDGPEFMAEDAKLFNYPFPYLYDESQEVTRAFGAVCTPEFFLFKKDGRRPFELVYHGQFDDSRPNNNVPITGRDLSRAIDCVLSGQPVPSVQTPSTLMHLLGISVHRGSERDIILSCHGLQSLIYVIHMKRNVAVSL